MLARHVADPVAVGIIVREVVGQAIGWTGLELHTRRAARSDVTDPEAKQSTDGFGVEKIVELILPLGGKRWGERPARVEAPLVGESPPVKLPAFLRSPKLGEVRVRAGCKA